MTIPFIRPFQDQGDKSTVAVLGAGPAGLSAAIGSLLNGNPTVIIEKRAEGAAGRTNTVALNSETLEILKQGGVYQDMLDNNLIFPEKDGICAVRITDLEDQLKEVIYKLAPREIIHYETTVEGIQEEGKATLTIRHSNGRTSKIDKPDFVINAEGPKSSTNELLGNRRIEVLPKMPVIAASLVDGRKINGIWSFFTAIGKTIYYTAAAIYYYTVYLFRLIFCSENFFSDKRQIAAALMLKTPGQHYIGLGFTKERSETLNSLSRTVNEKKIAYEQDRSEKNKDELNRAKSELRSFVNFWTNISFCEINAFALLGAVTCNNSLFTFGAWRPLDKFEVTEIGADRAEKCSFQKGGTAFIITGDALATVDPTTGLGCNTALQSAARIQEVIKGKDSGEGIDSLLDTYDRQSESVIYNIHSSSKSLRHQIRPDLA